MKITFFIGNGFDLNLGLKTTYSDFINENKKNIPSSGSVQKMYDHMDANSELWADAEIALGRFTGQFKQGEGQKFQECHKDFCEHLAAYLKEQEEQINYQTSEEKIKKAFAQLKNITRPFPTREKEILDAVYRKHEAEEITFQFISFNYTYTLDRCINAVKDKRDVLGFHRYKGRVIYNSIGSVSHVHGTVDENMIFAVNDETQIENISIFECKYGDICKDFLIKSRAMEAFREYTDAEAKHLLDQSQIVYIYGMSMGVTDKLWWNRICDWLKTNKEHHLIIQRYGAPSKGVFPIEFPVFERNQRRFFSGYGEYEEDIRNEMGNRIHITGENIFGEMHNMV